MVVVGVTPEGGGGGWTGGGELQVGGGRGMCVGAECGIDLRRRVDQDLHMGGRGP